jgi:hypothetical protein
MGISKLLLIVALSSTIASAQDKPCVPDIDGGMEVTVRKQPPLGQGTKLIVYMNGVAVQSPPKDVVFFSRPEDKILAWEGNPAKGKLNDLRGFDPHGGYFGKIKVKKSGTQLILTPDKDRPGDVVTVTFPEPATKKSHPTMIQTQVSFSSSPSGADLGTFTSQISWADQASGIDQVYAAGKKQGEKTMGVLGQESVLPPVGSDDIAEGQTSKLRTNSSPTATDMTGQGKTPAAPAPDTNKGG